MRLEKLAAQWDWTHADYPGVTITMRPLTVAERTTADVTQWRDGIAAGALAKIRAACVTVAGVTFGDDAVTTGAALANALESAQGSEQAVAFLLAIASEISARSGLSDDDRKNSEPPRDSD